MIPQSSLTFVAGTTRFSFKIVHFPVRHHPLPRSQELPFSYTGPHLWGSKNNQSMGLDLTEAEMMHPHQYVEWNEMSLSSNSLSEQMDFALNPVLVLAVTF